MYCASIDSSNTLVGRNGFAGRFRKFNHDSVYSTSVGNAAESSATSEEIDDCAAWRTTQADATLVETLVKLCRAEATSLLTVSSDSREIEYISGDSSTGVGSLVSIKLSP